LIAPTAFAVGCGFVKSPLLRAFLWAQNARVLSQKHCLRIDCLPMNALDATAHTTASAAPNAPLNWSDARGSKSKPWRMRIRNWLPEPLARDLQQELLGEVPWEWVFLQGGATQSVLQAQTRTLARAQIGNIWTQVYRGAAEGFQFSFRKYSIVEALRSGALRHPSLSIFIESIASRSTIENVRQLSACHDIQRVDAQATWYEAGDFLTEHTDDNDARFTRRVAYVLNLSPNWRAEWGGLLLFHDVQGNVVETFVPEFNTLNLFSVPQAHSVSMVAPFAKEKRLALTGWFTA
jgi:SM-20-related protein